MLLTRAVAMVLLTNSDYILANTAKIADMVKTVEQKISYVITVIPLHVQVFLTIFTFPVCVKPR